MGASERKRLCRVELGHRGQVLFERTARRCALEYLTRRIADSHRILVAAPRYLEAHGKPRSPNELRRHECLVHGDASAPAVWRFGTKAGKGVPVPIRGRFAANNSEAVALLAREGFGLALLADWLVAEDIRRGRLVPLLADFTAPPAPVYALSPPGKFSAVAVCALRDHLADSIGARLTQRA